MSSPSNRIPKQNGIFNGSKISSDDGFEPANVPYDDTEAKQRAALIEWMNSLLPNSTLSEAASSEELRMYLIDGAILLRILSIIKPGSVNQGGGSDQSLENVKKFLKVIDDMRIPRFEMSDLEKGSMKPVICCLLALRSKFVLEGERFSGPNIITRCGSPHGTGSPQSPYSPTYGDDKQKGSPRFNFQRSFRNALMAGSEPSSALMHHGGHKFHEVFQMKQGRYADLSAAKISEMMKANSGGATGWLGWATAQSRTRNLASPLKANSLDNAPTQSLLSVVNGILDESIERKNDEIPHRVACLLRKVVLEIERRISTQAEHLRTQNNLFKSREEKFQSRINVLEALAAGTGEQRGIEKSNSENEKREDAVRMTKEKDEREEDVIRLMKEMKQREDDLIKMMKEREQNEEIVIKLMKEKDEREEDVRRLIKEKEQREANDREHRDENVSLLIKEKEQREEDVRRLMKEKEEDIRRLMVEKGQREEHIRRLMEETEQRKEDIRCLMEEKEQKEVDIRHLMEEKEQREDDISRLMEEKEQRRANDSEHREENVSQLMEEKEQREEDVRRLTKEKKKREEDVRRLTEEKEQREENVRSLTKEKEQREEDVRQLIKEKEQREEDVRRLTKEKEQREDEIRRLMEEKDQKGENSLRLMKVNEQREADVRRLVEEKEQKEENALRLMKENEKREEDLRRLMKENEQREEDVRRLMKENEQREEDVRRLIKEKAQIDAELSEVKRESERVKGMEEVLRKKMEAEAKSVKKELEGRLVGVEQLLEESRSKVKVLEAYSASATQKWTKSERFVQTFSEFQFGALQDLRLSSKYIKQEVLRVQRDYAEEFDSLGVKFETFIDATRNYRSVLTENRKMYNELQDLKGNIRVYCRVRPFLPGQTAKQTTIEYIGENGEVMLVNPAKQGKDGRKLFRFNKAYGPDSSQGEVFSDTQPLIRSILDGYNVCIFAYGQTGSGKTYTMTGPTGASEEDWGVNYRALNDLFGTSKNRSGSFMYEVGVQMVEIYNEQVRDLLSNDASQKRLGIKSTATQSNGIAVPDASMLPVASTSDVIELMQLGLNNRAVSATAMNERSSRSHSVVSVHVRGKDLQSGAFSHGNLHLVDLAGSERVDRSEVTGDRLKEAQHINKSLSALGDVIFALAQKSSHVPYRNSKLTQLLQSSLGGQAKTLMFVQLNPDAESYSETFSTLKFAERVSGVELGAAKSSKEGRDVKELMDQIATLKDTIAKKDDEIEELQLLKSPGHSAVSDKPIGGSPHRDQKFSSGRRVGLNEKASSEHGDNSPRTAEDSEFRKTFLSKSKSSRDIGQDSPTADEGGFDYRDGEHEERYSYQSDDGHSAGTEPEGSVDEDSKPADKLRISRIAARIQSLQKSAQPVSKPGSLTRDPAKGSSSNVRKTVASTMNTGTSTNTSTSSAKAGSKGWR